MSVFSDIQLGQIVATLVYSAVGVITFILAYALIEKLSPYCVRKEISDDHNTALGIIIGAVILGLSIIIASAMH